MLWVPLLTLWCWRDWKLELQRPVRRLTTRHEMRGHAIMYLEVAFLIWLFLLLRIPNLHAFACIRVLCRCVRVFVGGCACGFGSIGLFVGFGCCDNAADSYLLATIAVIVIVLSVCFPFGGVFC